MVAPWTRVALVVAVIVALDQVSKAAVTAAVAPDERRALLPGIDLVNVRNPGIAFGLLGGGGALVLVLTVAALAALVVYFATHAARPGLWLPTGMLLGGAIGNLADRLRLGGVRDFIDLPFWPAFNLGDASISLGVLVLLYVEGRRDRARA